MYEDRFMDRALAISRQALGEAGAEPFAAVVVKDGRIVGEGLNRSAARVADRLDLAVGRRIVPCRPRPFAAKRTPLHDGRRRIARPSRLAG